ncbi:MAG: hypothetical protein A2Y38_10425 [Spirochaetes bacterium GWB1_59_5]|nr:MAG: hypothetical protein A2Y38_10425 [Spirochaetes bacterium GWB1_59_5]
MLNDCSVSLEKLREFLVGKTVQAVDATTETESIFRITLTDDTCIRVHATELGWWIEGTAPPGGVYRGLTGLFCDYGHHHYEIEPDLDFDVPEPTLEIDGLRVKVVSAKGRAFLAVAETEWEQKLLGHPLWLGHALRAGDLWRTAFRGPSSEWASECP